MSTEHGWFVERVAELKKHFPSVPIIAGGVHAMLYPYDLIAVPDVDFVCYGEGEATILQVLRHLIKNEPLEHVHGILYRKQGMIRQNVLNQFIELHEFREDRTIYYDTYPVLRDLPMKVFVSSRGCPYQCSFCVNAQLQRNFRGLGHYIRRKTVENFIAEIEEVKIRYGMKSVYIADDLFAVDKNWLSRFAPLYRERIGVPYICTCRADALDQEIIRNLVDSGCHTVTFGVETGNQELRMKILKKNITDEKLLAAAAMLRQAGLRFQTSNMFCLPGETVDDAVRTIDLNIRMGASYTMSAIFLPFPKTELTDLCIKQGVLKPDYSFLDMPHSFITRSALDLKNKGEIERLQKVAGLVIQYPRWRHPLIFAAKHVKIYMVHFILYLVGTVLRFRAERKITFIDTIRCLWSYRKSV